MGDIEIDSALFGRKGQVGVNRGLAEFYAGRPVLIAGEGGLVAALPVEGLDAQKLAAFIALCAPEHPRLIVTGGRARALGIETDAPAALRLASDFDADTILALVANAKVDRKLDVEPANAVANAAIQLIKLAQGLPAVLAAEVDVALASKFEPRIVTVEANAIARFREDAIQSLAIASEARVPLNSGTRTRFVVFRDEIGGNSVAVVVGEPNFANPVPVRLHSACLTGDVFGSRRCDCGDQLRLAIQLLEAKGGGVILYLEQEGRGLGLANKMRTYQLQDTGLDTVDANTTLGFDDDERDYGVAARMLQILGCHRVVLLTNNPVKLDGLAKAGIEITGRLPLEAPVNPDNRRYLTAKVARGGHRLDHLIASLAEKSDAELKPTPLAL